MKNTYRTQFQVCIDNRLAARALAAALKAAGYEAEVCPTDPTAVDHEAPYDVAGPLIAEAESAHSKGAKK